MNTTNTMGVLLAAGSLTALGLAETGCSYPNFDFGTGGSGGSMSTISTGGMGTGGSMPGINKMLLDYEFDVPGATEPDKSGNGFNGTLQGLNANSYVQIVPGNDALSFGGNGWVSVGVHSAFEGMNRLKIRARVNSDTQVGFAPIISDWVANPTPWSFFTNMD